MKESTIREAKSQLTSLIHEAEKGKAVRLTRRGKPVAVLVSDREYERMQTARQPRHDFTHFLQGWRREMIAKGLPFVSREELATARDHTPAREFSFEK
ncbi:MAG: type II toxin-antitoxin system Phd/YefM family antitoxin [Nevskiales bacterium]